METFFKALMDSYFSRVNLLMENQTFWFPLIIILSLIALFFTTAIFPVLIIAKKQKKRELRHQKLRNTFIEAYFLQSLPSSYEISLRRNARDNNPDANYYSLAFPHWKYANTDGSADRRRSANHLVKRECRLYIGPFVAKTNSPYELVNLVNTIRENGYHIEMNSYEQEKYQMLCQQNTLRDSLYSIQAIVRTFEKRPTDFETFCAQVFTCMGYETYVTSRTNDGGYDIQMLKNGISYIVECKCFALANPVGRPLLQKLVGANMTAHADIMAFVTTSSFSAPAMEYAQQFGIWLIDGNQLLEFYRLYATGETGAYTPSPSEWMLTQDDLRRYYPPDYRFNL